MIIVEYIRTSAMENDKPVDGLKMARNAVLNALFRLFFFVRIRRRIRWCTFLHDVHFVSLFSQGFPTLHIMIKSIDCFPQRHRFCFKQSASASSKMLVHNTWTLSARSPYPVKTLCILWGSNPRLLRVWCLKPTTWPTRPKMLSTVKKQKEICTIDENLIILLVTRTGSLKWHATSQIGTKSTIKIWNRKGLYDFKNTQSQFNEESFHFKWRVLRSRSQSLSDRFPSPKFALQMITFQLSRCCGVEIITKFYACQNCRLVNYEANN